MFPHRSSRVPRRLTSFSRQLLALFCVAGLAGTSLGQALFVPSGTSGIGVSANGNVGIGTNSPGHKITIHDANPTAVYLKGNTSGQAPYAAAYYVAESNIDYRGRGLFLPTTAGESGAAWFAGVPYTGGGFQIGNSSVHTPETGGGPYETAQARFFISNAGNVGIGTTSPVTKLDVLGSIAGDGSGTGLINLSNGAGAGGTPVLKLGTNNTTGYSFIQSHGALPLRINELGNNTLINPSTGNVGIGTTNPDTTLHVQAVGANARSLAMKVVNPATGSGAGAEILVGPYANNYMASISSTGNPANTYASDLWLRPRLSGAVLGDGVYLATNNNVGIGTTSPTHKLAVSGTVRAKEVIVETTGWSDYVFAEDYRLAPLSEVERHIQQNGHLPDVPSAADVAARGVSVGEMQKILLQKIEELTLHQIRLEKDVTALRAENFEMRQLLQSMAERP